MGGTRITNNEINEVKFYQAKGWSAYRIAKRLQVSVRLERSPLLGKIISSQDRCIVPTGNFNPNGFGCFVYVPVSWYDDQRVFEEEKSNNFFSFVLTQPTVLSVNSSIAMSWASFFVVAGAVMWFVQLRRFWNFKKRIFLD